ncbi:nucleotide sugar dehydrogenase [Streptacidiphilus sp. EB129]|uniref:nucleotide sugar dehydrogenase n=1 Tax=Streptacidiphilus sp. EB129 TaxID=3156262 RepID=UPI0035147967
MTLVADIRRGTAVVGVVGLGYVGLTNAIAFAEAGFRVVGLDVEPSRVARIGRGESHLEHVPHRDVARQVTAGRLTATTDFSVVAELDCILICVPTPVRHEGPVPQPDLCHVKAAAELIQPLLRRGSLIVLESTTYAGCTEEVLQPILERGGLLAGRDFLLGYAPERVDPGNARFAPAGITRVVSGCGALCREAIETLYAKVFSTVETVSSIRAAEMCKLFENTFRWVNIGLVNELKMLCDRLGIDVWEVVAAAATKPFGFMPFQPGPGVGGHCIPVDPYYLAWNARQLGLEARFVSAAGSVNDRMPEYVVQRTAEALRAGGGQLAGARLLVVGVAYKRDIDDIRESPAVTVMRMLHDRHALVDYHDPHVPELAEHLVGRYAVKSVPLSPEAIRSYDAVLILVDHSDIDWADLITHAALVVDTRNVTAQLTASPTYHGPHIVKA